MLYCENEACRYESPNTNVFTTLTLPLCSDDHCTLTECLTWFCEEEALPEVALCRQCECNTATKKKLKVTVWPNLLVIHLNRFKAIFDKSTLELLGHERLNTAISFPLSNFVVVPESAFISYDCVGVVNHMGQCSGGHYTADVLREDSWFHFDDNNTPIKIESPEGLLNAFNQNAYLLFFECRANARTMVDM